MNIMNFPTPENEQERVELLRKLDILDSLAESSYDFIVGVASRLFDSPVAFISFLDENRQWFKATVGLEVKETPREVAFCNYTILNENILVVEDMQQDDRFKNNPFVKDDPSFRFYAGFPITLGDDLRIGTVCVLDNKPRTFSENDKMLLKELAEHVTDLIKIRKISDELREKNREVQELQKLIPICSWCGKIKDDQNYWQSVESYISQQQHSKITHSICDDCSKNLTEDMELM